MVGVSLDAVLSTEGSEAVGAADQQSTRTEGDQYSYVVLAALLWNEKSFVEFLNWELI